MRSASAWASEVALARISRALGLGRWRVGRYSPSATPSAFSRAASAWAMSARIRSSRFFRPEPAPFFHARLYRMDTRIAKMISVQSAWIQCPDPSGRASSHPLRAWRSPRPGSYAIRRRSTEARWPIQARRGRPSQRSGPVSSTTCRTMRQRFSSACWALPEAFGTGAFCYARHGIHEPIPPAEPSPGLRGGKSLRGDRGHLIGQHEDEITSAKKVKPSIRAAEMIMLVPMRPPASGWRAMPSIAEAPMLPMPRPGPSVTRPVPMAMPRPRPARRRR